MKKLLLALLLTGCSSARFSYENNGIKYYEAKCNGAANSIVGCYKEASKMCKDGWTEQTRDTSSGLTFVGGGIYGAQYRSLLFTCN